jgi:aquaporin Z
LLLSIQHEPVKSRRNKGNVNQARSTGPALFVGDWALAQLWLFWLAPILGAVVGALVYRWLSEEPAGAVTGSDR